MVRVSPAAKEYADRLVLNVVAYNNGPTPANLGYENVSVAGSDGSPMLLFTAAQLEREARNTAAWAAFAVALAGAADAYSAQQSAYSYGGGSIHSYTPYGGIHSSYSYSSYNPAVANALTRQAADRTTGQIDQISAALGETINSLEGRILQTTTIEVGQIVGGQVVIAKPKLDPKALSSFVVRVAFNGEIHEFKFRVGAQEQLAAIPVASPAPVAPHSNSGPPEAASLVPATSTMQPVPAMGASAPQPSAPAVRAETAMAPDPSLHRPRPNAVAYCADGSFSYTQEVNSICRGHGGLQEWR